MPLPKNPLKNKTGIYGIRNTTNGKIYVGQAVCILSRFQLHFKSLRKGNHHCVYLQRSFTTHGESSFEKIVLEDCAPEQLTEREQFWMDHYAARTGIYNTAKAAGSPRGVARSAETRAKMSASKTGGKASEETKAKMREAHAARREVARAKAIAQWQVPGYREKVRPLYQAREATPETKAKLSAKLLERWSDPEYKKRLSEAHKQAQAKGSAKASARMSAMWADPEFRDHMARCRAEKKAAKKTP